MLVMKFGTYQVIHLRTSTIIKKNNFLMIYSVSFFYFLRDNSAEYSKTKDFIDKQISYVLKFGKLKSNLLNFIYSNKT